ncbi:MAG: bifunctional [glutamate--ammonia ligase]-adenylyl-L-tyrosine phosphorylase/[glutamate--ammonia-ligase] adenylyltransferase [Endozoicomonas sp.]
MIYSNDLNKQKQRVHNMEPLQAQFSQQLSTSGLPEPVQAVVATHWQHYFTSDFNNDQDVHALWEPHASQVDHWFLDALIQCWSGSDFAAQQCVRHPQWLLELFLNFDQLAAQAQNHQQRLAGVFEPIDTEEQLIQSLRRYRNREMLRIIWLDLNRQVSMSETTADLSAMADACVDLALEWLYQDSCKTLGTPYGAINAGNNPDGCLTPQKMVVLGMGKLGACDLNLSSDIDLMFTYPAQGETQGGRRSLTNQEFFIRLGQRLIWVLDCQNAEGFVFRVDMRLRPYGNSGALAMSFAAMEQYYQDQGRDWERYAMLKARVIAGDLPSGNELLNQLRPFVYRRYIDFGSISALREMKRLIQREVKRKGMETNIKLGPGGIREIEFIVQSFQLIHGGRDRSLQERNLLRVLDILSSNDYFSKEYAAELREAYEYLRNLEHALQAIADRQTQDLPKDALTQARVAVSMAHPDWLALLDTLESHKQIVIRHFEAVIADPDDQNPPEQETDQWLAFWLGQLNEEEELQLLLQSGFSEPTASRHLLLTLRDGKAITRVRRQSRERLDRFLPQLLKVVSESAEPDILLVRLLPLVEAVLRRTAYLVLLMENPAALEHLGQLCIASPWIADQIARHPGLLDEFLNLGDLYNPPLRDELADELRQQLAHTPADDLENQMEALRHFKMAHILRVTAAQVSGKLPLMKESDYLTWIAEVILEAVVAIAWRNLTEKYGEPRNPEGKPCGPGFIILGYGKLGGIELGPGSDLDLVFVHNGAINSETTGPRTIDSSTFYTRIGQRIIHILTTQTPSGILYDADMRLRPSGSKGLLVSSFSAFEKYQQQEAWTWEHQALVRARVVAGDKVLARQFDALRATVLCLERDAEQLLSDVTEMREKMRAHFGSKPGNTDQFHLKHDTGGIVDIEFLMQYAVLRYAREYPSLVQWTDNIRTSEELETVGLLNHEAGQQLRNAYKTFRLSIHQRALQNQPPIVPAATAEVLRQQVMAIWQALLNTH